MNILTRWIKEFHILYILFWMIACYLNTSSRYASLPYEVQLTYVFICFSSLHLSGLRKLGWILDCILLRIFFLNNSFCFQLFSARDMAQKTVIGQDQIVYSTDKDFLDQDYEANEWDKKFRELERSDWEALKVIQVKQFNHYIWIIHFNVLRWQSNDHSIIMLIQWSGHIQESFRLTCCHRHI